VVVATGKALRSSRWRPSASSRWGRPTAGEKRPASCWRQCTAPKAPPP